MKKERTGGNGVKEEVRGARTPRRRAVLGLIDGESAKCTKARNCVKFLSVENRDNWPAVN